MQVPYHRSLIGEEEIAEVVDTLKSGWLTSGKKVEQFEAQFKELKNGAECVAVSSCTAGLFLALAALELEEEDEVITTPFSFVATANTILHNGATPVFADIDPHTLNISPEAIQKAITENTRAISVVHLGGNPCQMDEILEIAHNHELAVIEDCAHAVDGEFGSEPLGTLGMAGAFSFYPNKNITTAEGGMLVTQDPDLADWFRKMRKHGLSADVWQRKGSSEYRYYDVLMPGFKYNLTDFQASLGIHQMNRLADMQDRRRKIRRQYDKAFKNLDGVLTIRQNHDGISGDHLYILRIEPEKLNASRDTIIREIQEQGVMLSVTYHPPIHLFTWYRHYMGFEEGDFPEAEKASQEVFCLPFYPSLTDEQVNYVIEVVGKVITAHH